MAKKSQVKVGRQSSREDQRLQEEQWRGLLREQSRSGMTQREFCRRQSIPEHRFSWWKREIAIRDGRRSGQVKAGREKKAPRRSIVPVRITKKGTLASQFGEEPSFEIVLPGGRVLRVPHRFDDEALARLLRLLEA